MMTLTIMEPDAPLLGGGACLPSMPSSKGAFDFPHRSGSIGRLPCSASEQSVAPVSRRLRGLFFPNDNRRDACQSPAVGLRHDGPRGLGTGRNKPLMRNGNRLVLPPVSGIFRGHFSPSRPNPGANLSAGPHNYGPHRRGTSGGALTGSSCFPRLARPIFNFNLVRPFRNAHLLPTSKPEPAPQRAPLMEAQRSADSLARQTLATQPVQTLGPLPCNHAVAPGQGRIPPSGNSAIHAQA